VQIEELVASHMVTQHLLMLGHKRIAFLTGPTVAPWRMNASKVIAAHCAIRAWTWTTVWSFKPAAQSRTVSKPHFRWPTKNRRHGDPGGERSGGHWLRQYDAQSTYPHSARPLHRRIGNVLIAEHFRVPLTTVRQPKFRLGTAAVDAMMQLLGGKRFELKRLPAELIVRDSTAPPPRNK
jgi:LacI family transcriptional regulator